MVPFELILLNGILLLVVGFVLGWFTLRGRRSRASHTKNPEPSRARLGNTLSDQLGNTLSEIEKDVADHAEGIRSFGDQLKATESSPESLSEISGDSLSGVRKTNRSFIDRTERNMRIIPKETEGGRKEFADLRSSLRTHLDGSEELDQSLSLSESAGSAEQERLILMETIESLLKSKEHLESSLHTAQKHIQIQEGQLKEAEHEARHDQLTRLPNRRMFEERLTQLQTRFEIRGRVYSCLMIDLDKFKPINDEFGHAAGDAVLSVLAHLLRTMMPELENIARLGGDEFAVLLPDKNLSQARFVAIRLRDRIVKVSVKHDEHDLKFTVSIGAAEVAEGEKREDLLRRADEALYGAKRAGRNGICVYGEHDPDLSDSSSCESPDRDSVAVGTPLIAKRR